MNTQKEFGLIEDVLKLKQEPNLTRKERREMLREKNKRSNKIFKQGWK